VGGTNFQSQGIALGSQRGDFSLEGCSLRFESFTLFSERWEIALEADDLFVSELDGSSKERSRTTSSRSDSQ
jgi:hypothetical protein